RSRQAARFDVIVDRMLAADEGLVPFDGRVVDQRHRTAHRGLIVTEAIPTESFGRPDEPRGGRSFIECLSRQRLLGYVDRDAAVAERHELADAPLADGRRAFDAAGKEYVDRLFHRF